VRNCDRKSYICVAFVLASALSLLAQSDRVGVQRLDDSQPKANDPRQSLLTATLVETPATGSLSSESELPDAPSATKPATSDTDPVASPVVRDSHGARPAAMGGPFGVEGTVADRNYILVTGAMFGASIANAELTLHCLGIHTSCNDVPGFLKSRIGLYGVGIPADLGMAYLTYYLKRKHSRIWYVPAALVTGANVFFGIRAYRWSQN
jgi:hypothetical protein